MVDTLSKYPTSFIPTTNHPNIYLSMFQTIQYINHCRVQNAEYRRYSKVHETAFYASQKTAISYHTIALLTSDCNVAKGSLVALFIEIYVEFSRLSSSFSWLLEGLLVKSWRVYHKRFVFE